MIDLQRAALLAKGDDKFAVTVSRSWLREVVAELAASRADAARRQPIVPHLDVVPLAAALTQ
ncbi:MULTISPECIES: hypothetical protein [Novosphingobium]|uniref:Uncharacterized protein n=1 Tax=Novosphingobium clariflavum TaxID=2029884 RepID=A0ABV6S4N8_9SPHN|nr:MULTISPECIES: hypothetical protein [Novosphingobium]QSR16053.1 hypothetical protein CA833_02380 [Novosphingobium sp. KA1]